MNTNAKLLIATLVLLGLSAWTYVDSVSRGDRFARGQKFLPNLNPDEVFSISIVDGEDEVTLVRSDNEFTVAEKHNYPARNDAVNRFLRDLLDIALDKEVGTGPELAAELEIDPMTESTTEIALGNQADQEMVRLRLGTTFDDGTGRYVQRVDEEDARIFLTSESTYLSTRADSFLEKELLNVSQSQVVNVTGPDFRLSREEGSSTTALESVPGGKKEKSVETGKLKGFLSNLSFEDAFLADDEEVRDLRFEQVLDVEIDDETGYLIAFAESGEGDEATGYIRLRGHHDVGRVEIAPDEAEEELELKADKLSRADEIEEFNAFHDSWVYSVSDFVADKLRLRKSDLLEDES